MPIVRCSDKQGRERDLLDSRHGLAQGNEPVDTAVWQQICLGEDWPPVTPVILH